jgi:hypothetical protein
LKRTDSQNFYLMLRQTITDILFLGTEEFMLVMMIAYGEVEIL